MQAIANTTLRAATGASVQSLAMDGIGCQAGALISALKSWTHSLQHVGLGSLQIEASSEHTNNAAAMEQAWKEVFLALGACERLDRFSADRLRVMDEAGEEYEYTFYERLDQRRSKSVSVEGRDEVVELLEITIQKGIRVEDD